MTRLLTSEGPHCDLGLGDHSWSPRWDVLSLFLVLALSPTCRREAAAADKPVGLGPGLLGQGGAGAASEGGSALNQPEM